MDKKAEGFDKIAQREQGLARKLTAGQMSMIAIGGAIGMGLFFGSRFAISSAGPSVIISYAIGGLIALMLVGCLAEMTVVHSTSGSFGAYAEYYIHPLAGFLVRYAYWSCAVFAVGLGVTSVAQHMTFWFPNINGWLWVVLLSGVLIFINAMSVKTFGTVEYWFSTIKICAIVVFIFLGMAMVWANPYYGSHNYTTHRGFSPKGLSGMWIAVVISIFSYSSVEMIAVAAGEAEDPENAVKKAFRATIIRLVVFYLLTLSLLLVIVPWDHYVRESPFITVMNMMNIPFAADILNFVVLIAALSAMNSQLYIATRMMFSLSCAGRAPKICSKLSPWGTPLNALLLSGSVIAVVTAFSFALPQTFFVPMAAVVTFGALFTWMMIFVTHYFFRRAWERQNKPKLSFRMAGFPVLTLAGAGAMLAILITTVFIDTYKMTLAFGIPFLYILIVYYIVTFRDEFSFGER